MANFCTECGRALESSWNICPYCGTPAFRSESSFLATDIRFKEQSPSIYQENYISTDNLQGQYNIPYVEKKKRGLSKRKKRAIVIVAIIITAATVIPLATIFSIFHVRTINYYVGNGVYSRSHISFIPRINYDYYLNQPHPSHNLPDWDDVALTIASYCTPDDTELLKIAQEVKSNCISQNDDEEVVNALLSYSQGIEYKLEIEDLAQYPLETLINQGDCEDLSIFFGSLVETLGYEAIIMCVIIYSESSHEWFGHCCVGVHLDEIPTSHHSFPPSYYYNTTTDENKYWVCETTDQGWMIGQLPASDPSYFLVESYAYV